jgi:CheY-like chemotaxis protein
MGSPRILVVDDDAWILRMVTTVLEKRGYEIFVARDGEEGLAKAHDVQPDLIVTDVMMPKMDGWALVKQLRSSPLLAFVPVIFLTALGSDEDRIRGFRLGADDYLAKPFRFEELDLRVAKALRNRGTELATREKIRNTQPQSGPQLQIVHHGSPAGEPGFAPPRTLSPRPGEARPGIHGSLDQLGLSSLLIVLEMERKSGLLVLSRAGPGAVSGDAGETGRLFLRDGRVVRVRIDGQVAPKNEAAIYHLLGWAEGQFEFSALEVDMEDEVKLSTTALLIEGARRLDEARKPG